MKLLAELKDALENVVWDAEGGFDPRKDRERYIRYLEEVNTEWAKEAKSLREQLDAITDRIAEQEEIKFLMESR